MLDALDIMAMTCGLSSTMYLGLSIGKGSFNSYAYSMVVVHENDKECNEKKEYEE